MVAYHSGARRLAASYQSQQGQISPPRGPITKPAHIPVSSLSSDMTPQVASHASSYAGTINHDDGDDERDWNEA